MQFRIKNPSQSQEGFVGGVLFAIFVLPYLVALVAGSIIVLSDSIRRWRDSKRSPEEKLAKAIEEMSKYKDYFDVRDWFPDKRGLSDDDALTELGYKVAPDPRLSNPKLSVANVIATKTFMAMLDKFKSFVSKIAAISDTENCMKTIDNAFKQSFDVKKDVVFDTNEFKEFNYAKYTAKWPNDPFYKNVHAEVEKFEIALHKLMPQFKILHAKVSQAIAAKIEGESKEELQGRVAFIKTCDMIVKMYNNLYTTFDSNLDALYYVDVVGVDENGEVVQELGNKYIEGLDGE